MGDRLGIPGAVYLCFEKTLATHSFVDGFSNGFQLRIRDKICLKDGITFDIESAYMSCYRLREFRMKQSTI